MNFSFENNWGHEVQRFTLTYFSWSALAGVRRHSSCPAYVDAASPYTKGGFCVWTKTFFTIDSKYDLFLLCGCSDAQSVTTCIIHPYIKWEQQARNRGGMLKSQMLRFNYRLWQWGKTISLSQGNSQSFKTFLYATTNDVFYIGG